MFCPKCGTLLRPYKKEGARVLRCPSCGYEAGAGDRRNALKISDKIQHSPKERTIVIEGKERVETLPKVRDIVSCPKCGHNEAYYWIMQTRAADEPPTRFYRCVKCGHTWREYE